MRSRAAYLRVGLFVVAATGILIGLVLFLGGSRVSQGAKFETYFRESVQGLDVGAPVKFRGVTIGQVTEIGLVRAEYGQPDDPEELRHATYQLVLVRYVIDLRRLGPAPDTVQAVQSGLRARLASQGLTGLSYIELDFVDPKQFPVQAVPWVSRDTWIPSMPSTLSQVQDAAQQFAAKLNRIDFEALAGAMQGLVGDLRQEMAEGDVRRTLTRAADLLETLRGTVQAAQIPELTDDLRRTSTSVRDLAQSREVKTLLTNLAASAARLSDSLKQLPQVVASINTTARRAGDSTADVQASLVPLLRDMQAAAANLRDTTETLRRYPAQVLLGGPPPRENRQ